MLTSRDCDHAFSSRGRFIFVKTTSKSTTDVLFVDLSAKEVKAVMFQPRQDGLRYTVGMLTWWL